MSGSRIDGVNVNGNSSGFATCDPGVPWRYALIKVNSAWSGTVFVDWDEPGNVETSDFVGPWKRQVFAETTFQQIDTGTEGRHRLVMKDGASTGFTAVVAFDTEPFNDWIGPPRDPLVQLSTIDNPVLLDSGGTLKGQMAMASSLPVAIASDQSAVPVTFADKTVKLDSGGTLVGAQVKAASVPVVIASDQTVPVSLAAALDVSDRAGRAVGHVSLDSGGTLKGQATMANSVPVALASDQSAVDVSDRAGRAAGHVSLDNGGTLKGQNTMANSVPVTLASDQGSIAVAATPASPAGLKFAAFDVTTAVGATSPIIAAVAGKTITVYAISWQIIIPATASGNYFAQMQDGGATPVVVDNIRQGMSSTTSGTLASPRSTCDFKGGNALTLSAALNIKNTGSSAAFSASGIVAYTQV